MATFSRRKGANTADLDEDDENDYDPVANRPPGPLTSDLAAMMHLLKGSIGNGILFLPNGYKRAGYVMSVICGAVIGLLCTHTVVTLVRCAQLLCKRNRIPMMDLAKTAEVSLQSGPEWIRKYGKMFGVFTNIIICLIQFEVAVVYILYVSTSCQQVIEFFSEFKMDARIYIVALFPIACLLGFIPNLKYMAPFSMVGFLFVSIGICVTISYLVEDIPDPGRLRAFTHVLSVPMYCTIFLFAMHNVTVCMPLENSMKYPHHLPWLITLNMLINTCLYTLFGFLGYNKYAESTCDTVIKNLPVHETLAQTIKITISLSVLFSFGLAYYVPYSIIWPLIETKYETFKYAEEAYRFSQVVGTTLVGIAIPQMVPLLGLLTAISMTTMMLLIPIVVETTTMWKRATKLFLAKNVTIFVVWVLLMVCGVIESTWSIIREYNDVKDEQC